MKFDYMEYKGYTIIESSGHGKVVKGMKKTSSIQIRQEGTPGYYLLLNQITFPVNDVQKKEQAFEKAKKYIDKKLIK